MFRPEKQKTLSEMKEPPKTPIISRLFALMILLFSSFKLFFHFWPETNFQKKSTFPKAYVEFWELLKPYQIALKLTTYNDYSITVLCRFVSLVSVCEKT